MVEPWGYVVPPEAEQKIVDVPRQYGDTPITRMNPIRGKDRRRVEAFERVMQIEHIVVVFTEFSK